MPTVLITGGCGYIGVPLAERLLAAEEVEVRVLDALVHGQHDVAMRLRAAGADVVQGDVRDAGARELALAGVDAVVHLAAIVGDPACAREPQLAQEVNVDATRALVDEARALGVGRFVFASTCSNYGRLADPTVPIGEDGELRPVSLYAEQKVAMERTLLDAAPDFEAATCLRLATIYGVAPRMRFDLTVNEFTRDLWAGRRLEVFGEQFWRPYLHVADAGRAVASVLAAPAETVAGEVFNVGRPGENYRKLDLVEEIRRQCDSGEVAFVAREEDPRDYQVAFDKVRGTLGFETEMTVPDGIAEVLRGLEAGAFGDPFDRRWRNLP